MLTLLKSEKFQKEYKDFQDKISTVTNENIKKELEGLLSKLVNEVKSLDLQHQELSTTKQFPITASDARSNIIEIRKQIDRRLRDWAES
jgi:hypothetical protein